MVEMLDVVERRLWLFHRIQERTDMWLTPLGTEDGATQHKNWALEDIPWRIVRREVIVDDEELFYLLTTASFTKTAIGLYVNALVRRLSVDIDIQNWVELPWRREQLKHGMALKRYIRAVWPNFDWDSAYEFFYKEYAATYPDKVVASSKSLEMAARCAVELVNASYYAALSNLSREPLLTLLARYISEDEVRH